MMRKFSAAIAAAAAALMLATPAKASTTYTQDGMTPSTGFPAGWHDGVDEDRSFVERRRHRSWRRRRSVRHEGRHPRAESKQVRHDKPAERVVSAPPNHRPRSQVARLEPRGAAAGQSQPSISDPALDWPLPLQLLKPILEAPVAILAAVGQAIGPAPRRLRGTMLINDERIPYGSGGHGYSIPYGDYRITPDAVGPWGARHGAIGIAGGEIWDKRLHRYREGIELHRGYNKELITSGCVVVPGRAFGKLKSKIFAMMKDFGHAFLHVGPMGALISPIGGAVIVAADAEPRHQDDRANERPTRHRRHRHYEVRHRHRYWRRHRYAAR